MAAHGGRAGEKGGERGGRWGGFRTPATLATMGPHEAARGVLLAAVVQRVWGQRPPPAQQASQVRCPAASHARPTNYDTVLENTTVVGPSLNGRQTPAIES